MKKTLYKMTLPILAALTACGTFGAPGDYRHKSTRTGGSRESQISEQKIASDTTYQVFFNITKPEKCLKISFVSVLRESTLKTTVTKEVNTYFVVEKIVDIDRFKVDKKTIFYEVGKNFDTRWNNSHLIVICSDALDPLKKMDPGLYRIRFSSFRSPEYHYTIDIYSNVEPVAFGF